MPIITVPEYDLVYNAFSFTLAAMGAGTLFLWLSRGQVAPAYRTALTVSGLVTAIAAYHYFRIFESWTAAYTVRNNVLTVTGVAFNDAYRYVDWLLTVPLLLIELILVMRLPAGEGAKKSIRLGSAAALMIVLGYPGEIAHTNTVRAIWGTAATVPFLYIVYELFAGLSASIDRQPPAAKGLVKQARLITFAAWGFYPIVYMIPYTNLSGGAVITGVQIGYTIADIIAKVGVGILIFNIARLKSQAEDASAPGAPGLTPALAV